MKTLKRKKLMVGAVLTVPVQQPHIDQSTPCNKEECMLTLAGTDYLTAVYGDGNNYKVKSTNHGMIFDLNGRRYTSVFDTKTGNTIYGYDETFKVHRSKARACSIVKPFKARLIIEASVAIPTFPPMSEAAKKRLREYDRSTIHRPGRTKKSSRRELSL